MFEATVRRVFQQAPRAHLKSKSLAVSDHGQSGVSRRIPAGRSRQGGRQEQQCALWREAAIKRIGEIGAHAAIVATSTEYQDVSPKEWFNGTRMLAQRLTSSSVQTLFMRDTPAARFDVPQCLARAAWRGSGDCNLIRSKALEQTVFGIEQAVAESVPYV